MPELGLEVGSEPARPSEPAPRAGRPGNGVLLLPLVGLIAALWAALSFDVVRTTYGIKGDEATYVSMALSLAHDGDLTYERRDLERFYPIYRDGPNGIFLKRGRDVAVGLQATWPFVRVSAQPDPRQDRLYFGKAYLYPVVAAPFVRWFGLNGFLVLHVLLLGGVLAGGYAFLAARSAPAPAMLFATAFLGASVVPVYAVLLHSDTLNFALVFLAYFFWLYKEVAPPRDGRFARWLRGWPSDAVAAVLLGLATFSKPSNVLLVLPMVALAWWRRRFTAGFLLGLLFAAVVAGAFGVNAAVTGELNYQGGDRKIFYGRFPFDAPGATLGNLGIAAATDALVLAFDGYRFLQNVEYFWIGRHFGFIPYCFPAVVALGLALIARQAFRVWHALVLGAAGATASALLIWLPEAWPGGGGLPGNRYFLSVYPAFFFLVPPLRSVLPGLLAWAGGTLFTAHILLNPFVALKYPWTSAQQGTLRRLPVELSAASALPAMVQVSRCRVPYGGLQLCYLDDNAFLPEPSGLWIAGAARAEILLRSPRRIESLGVRLYSPVSNLARVRVGGAAQEVTLRPDRPAMITLEPWGQAVGSGFVYLLAVETTRGFVPHLQEPTSRDARFLGVQLQFQTNLAAPHSPSK